MKKSKTLLLALVAASVGFVSGQPVVADTVWFEDSFATGDARQADYPGFRDPQATDSLPNVKGIGGGYTYSAYARGQDIDGYVLLGAKRGLGLIAKFAKVQTTNTWRLADVPKGKILRFEMKGVAVGRPQREAGEGFGLSDSSAAVMHNKDVHNIIWTFYRPGEKPGGVRPYVQWAGSRYSADTAKISAKISDNPSKPDDLAIEYDPDKGTITFLQNRQPVYVFSDPQGIEALSKVPLSIVFQVGWNKNQTIGMAGWSLKLDDTKVKQ